jgi:hypothetical protein
MCSVAPAEDESQVLVTFRLVQSLPPNSLILALCAGFRGRQGVPGGPYPAICDGI